MAERAVATANVIALVARYSHAHAIMGDDRWGPRLFWFPIVLLVLWLVVTLGWVWWTLSH
jgi:hypothetical protein